MEDEKNEQTCNQSQQVETSVVCDEEMKHKERDENTQWDASLNISNSETFCQENMFFLNPVKKQNDIPLEVLEKN